MDGDYALIGAHKDDSTRGSAFVFMQSGSTWTDQAKLNASDGEKYDRLGYSESISGNYAVAGAYGEDTYHGAVCVFVRSGSNWIQESKLFASDGDEKDYFGCSISIQGGNFIVGAWEIEIISEIKQGLHIFLKNNSLI